jgi:hypothetical protein
VVLKFNVLSFGAGALLVLAAVMAVRRPENVPAYASSPAQAVEETPTPQSVIESFALTGAELPGGYLLVSATNILGDLGLTSNPDLIGKKSDLEAIGGWGGAWGFCAAYGATNEARLLLHGIYFKLDDYVQAFADFQHEQQRHVACFKKPAEQGAWVLMIAKDPEQDYTGEEIRQLRACVDGYQRRLGLDLLFNDLDSTNSL